MPFFGKNEKTRFKRVEWRNANYGKEKSRFFRVTFYFLLLCFAGVTAYILFFSAFLQISNITLAGTEELDKNKIADYTKEMLGGKYLWLIPKNNIILISNKGLEEKLLEKFKKISKVQVSREFPGSIKITLEERKSLLLWCSAGPCYIIDENGYAYSGADFESAEIKENNLIRLINSNAKPVSIGEKVLKEEYINFVLNMRESFQKEIGRDISDEFLTPFQAAEEMQVKTQDGWVAYFNSQLPLDKSLETLRIFLQEKIGASPEDWSKLEYVDLRVENKVFYKLKGEEGKENSEDAKKEEDNKETKKKQ